MKRLLPLLLILLLIPCLAVPVSATSTNTILENIYDNVVDIWIQNDMWYETFGQWLSDIVDYLGWIDQEVSSIETNVLKILQEIYTQGTLTIGECVKGIRSYIVQINDKLETGIDKTVGILVAEIRGLLESIYGGMSSLVGKVSTIVSQLSSLVKGDKDKADAIVEDATQKQEEIDEMVDILETAPSVNQDDFDDVISDANGKFQNMTTDASGAVLFSSLGQIASSDIFAQLIPTAGMLAVISFALFGRVY